MAGLRVSVQAALQPRHLEEGRGDRRLDTLLHHLEGIPAADFPDEREAARIMRCSASTLQRLLHRAFRLDYPNFRTILVMAAAREALLDRSRALEEVARSAGYGSERAFIRAFRKSCGLTPGEFRSLPRRPPT